MLSILWVIIIGLLICIYLVKGLAGVYAWNFSIFIAAPIGVILSIICFITLLVRIFKKTLSKKLLLFQITFLIIAFPILLLLGIISVPYPATFDESKALAIDNPIGSDAVFMGGASYKTHAMWPSERFAYDILVKPYDIKSTNLNDYGIFGRDVHSPVEGTVISIHDGEDDITPNTDEFTSSSGNYIYIKSKDTGTYLVLAHLKKDSICVKIGDSVSKGEVLGKVGNSGTTSEPHLHLQHQKQDPRSVKFTICAEGLPMKLNK
jgi:hypothetical protein